MSARLYRIFPITAMMVVLGIGAPHGAHAAQDVPATADNGYTYGGAMQEFITPETPTNNDSSWLQSQADRLSIVGGAGGWHDSAHMPVMGGPYAGYYSPRDSLAPLRLDDESAGGFTPRDTGMLGLVYAAEKWQLGAGYAHNSPAYVTDDPLQNRIDLYTLGTRYDAFGAVGFGASIELREYKTGGEEDNPDEKVFTFGTYINF